MKFKSAVTVACFWIGVHVSLVQPGAHQVEERGHRTAADRIERHVNALFFYTNRFCASEPHNFWAAFLPFGLRPCVHVDEAVVVAMAGTPFVFEHPASNFCLRRMDRLHKIDPFFEAWDTYRSCQSVFPLEEQFLREFCIMTLLIYKNLGESLFREKVSVAEHRSFLADAIVLYQRIDRLPVVQILGILDEFLDEFSLLSDEHEQEHEAAVHSWQRFVGLGIKIVPVIVVILWSWFRSNRAQQEATVPVS